MSVRHKVIIDADPGIGDAVAITLALMDPQIEVVALTSCAGLVSGDQAFRNLQTIISMVDPPLWPRLGWSNGKSFRVEDSPVFSGILSGHGESGLGDCRPIAAPLHQPTDSVKLMVELVRAHPGELTLLTLGPLTNVLGAFERSSEFLSELKQLRILGGSVSAGGDVTACAELNMLADPVAAKAILTSPANKTLLPLDTSHQFELSFDQYSQLGVDGFSRLGRLLNELIPFALRISRTQLGREGILLPEVMAVASISHSELFEQRPMVCDVELTGELTRGMTVFDRRPVPHWKQNIEVLTEVDTVGVLDYMLRLIASSGVGE
ncbi:Pyrimidine-specific ribonucleoside hydrolase RihA [Thalassoglobus neptunius]|uniref:Pyrimidine-specific ribonucleoside hydrolase RihA n=1 Tax=Thalassoglobus neptunius TaxID=1938619 RepID=A0A5C5WIV7_9PLAN|nr:nucleoside hydrolase [Thalassoglobus neptunius]TWT50059.1 Pyrimidine-specific ribonucleoside hydrolase RihA [Thalassoglobus neptunius]